jgi:hypothetical protein
MYFMPFFDADGSAGTDKGDSSIEEDKGGKEDESTKEKTYTQKELNAIAKREKASGKNVVLKELFGELDDYTEAIVAYKAKKRI